MQFGFLLGRTAIFSLSKALDIANVLPPRMGLVQRLQMPIENVFWIGKFWVILRALSVGFVLVGNLFLERSAGRHALTRTADFEFSLPYLL